MKKIIYSTISFFTLLLISSCSDLLDTVPITDEVEEKQEEQVLKNADEAEEAMKLCHQMFGIEYWQFDWFFLGDAGSDVAYAGADQETFYQIDEYRILSTNYVVERDWKWVNDFVKRCNLVINYANTTPGLSQERKDEMIGEASLNRALVRFMAVQTWGEFPIVNATVTSINNQNFDANYQALFPSRKPVNEVYDAIISDCEVALLKAPTSTSVAESKYKGSKNAAKALLAKVYATKNNPDWGKVIQYCDEVINGGYSLLTTYDHLFDSNHEGNSESIWEINGEGNGSTINSWCTNVFLGNNWKKFNTPSHKLSNSFGLDIRKTSSIKLLPTTFSDPYYITYNNFPNPWKMRKTDGTQNFYIFRLADVILLKAEALARTGDLTGSMTLVNQIRSRVNLANISPATSENDAINKILDERFKELCFEGHRWYDLKRTKKSIEILSQQTYPKWNPETESYISTPLPGAQEISDNDLLWPVPQSQRDNNPNLTQNPGY